MIRSSHFAGARPTFLSAAYLQELMEELDRAAISVRLAESRANARLSQPEMAELLQRGGEPLHWRTVQNYESPKNDRVPWDLLGQWAEATGTSKEWLLHGDQPTPEPATVEEIREARKELAEVRETSARIEQLLLSLLERDGSPTHSERP